MALESGCWCGPVKCFRFHVEMLLKQTNPCLQVVVESVAEIWALSLLRSNQHTSDTVYAAIKALESACIW